MDQSICIVHIKEIFRVTFFVTSGRFKDLLSILTSLISIQDSKKHNIVL